MRSISFSASDVSQNRTASVRPIIPARYFSIPRAAIAAFIVLAAVAISPIVFTEPAPVDLLLMGSIIALPLLFQTRPGLIATTVLALMFVNVACAFVIAPAVADFGNDVKHQVITLYLVLAGFVIAGYISMDPIRRTDRVMVVYVLASTFAAALALVGFFSIIPGTTELFTLFGRARGTFKDPNVLGAAIAPAFIWLLWSVTNAKFSKAKWSLLGLGIIGAAILLTFSRGAWLSVVASMAFTSVFIAASLQDPRKLSRFVCRFLPAAVLFPIAMLALLQIDTVRDMAEVRFRLDQSYDSGPYGRFGGQAKAMDLTLQNPFGIGTSGFLKHHLEQPHNVYLTMFLSAGWIGGLAYVVAVLLTLGAGIFHSLVMAPMQRLQILVTAAFFGLVVQGFIIDTDHWRHFFLVQALVIGLADAALRERAQRRAATAVAVRLPLKRGAPTRRMVRERLEAEPATERRPRRWRPQSPVVAPNPIAPPLRPKRAAPAAGLRTGTRHRDIDQPSIQQEHHVSVISRPAGPTHAEIAARASHNDLAGLLEQSRRPAAAPRNMLEARLNERGPLEKSGLVSATHMLRRRIERDFAA